MASKIFRPKRGTSSGLGTSTVLASGELFFEYPSGGVGTGKVKVKMGNGSTAYSSLPYAINTEDLDGDASDATVAFTQATSTSNSTLLSAIASGATIATLIGNIKQMLSNLNDSVTSLNNDLSSKYFTTIGIVTVKETTDSSGVFTFNTTDYWTAPTTYKTRLYVINMVPQSYSYRVALFSNTSYDSSTYNSVYTCYLYYTSSYSPVSSLAYGVTAIGMYWRVIYSG